ncbi:unnamed protein product [Eruca vesicaria subsp. sativa]|uniref:Argonaute 1 n=1 Tax=Eruca vesicaria subsp. sativa TaxID=29727 RepID=A0ABC8JHC9_ERUVS|nr:unnamed protein product [Eruca vesicaria subsp. sativa]
MFSGKKRTDGSSEVGEGSGPREAAPVSGRGRGGQHQGGRGYNSQSQSGRGYGHPPQQYGGPRGRQPPQQYSGPRGGGPPRGGGRGGSSSAGLPHRQSVPDLHQATPPTYQAVSSQPTQMPDPPAPVQQFEQLSIEQGASSQAIQSIPSSSQIFKFPVRHGRGQFGRKCIVKANHFAVEFPDKDVFHYDVTITPEVTSRGVNRAVMKQLVARHGDEDLGGRLPVYDGRKNLYTAHKLPFDSNEFTIALLDEEAGPVGHKREREFKVVIKLAASVNMYHLGMFLLGQQADAPQEALQALDIVLRELPTSKYTPVGRSFYSRDVVTTKSLGDGLESWRGFYQSIRPTQMGLSLNVDISSTAFIEPRPVTEFVFKLLNRESRSRQPLSDADRVKIKKALRGVKVEVTHQVNMRRKYRISGLSTGTTRELTFPVDERNTQKSVVDYFYETYGLRIQHTQLPCLQVGNSNTPKYLPMEVCEIVGGQRYSKRLNAGQITALLKVTCQRPKNREEDIGKTVGRNDYSNDPYAKAFGIKISESLTSVEARVLPPPWLEYHDSGTERTCRPQVGQWNMMNKKMINGGTVSNWICINFSTQVRDNHARNFCQELAQMCLTSGIEFNREPVLPSFSARPQQVEKDLKTLYHDAMAKVSKGKEIDLLIVILPDNNGSLYGDLKRICETELGIVSQCCLTKHVFNTNGQYLANVALKINVKVGGRNTVLVDALSMKIPLVCDRPTIIFGADVTHPHPGEDSSPSIAAVVASQDWPGITKYAGLVCAQAPRQEIIQDLFKEWKDPQTGVVISGGMIKELLIAFHRSTGHKPLRIIFYRDGVSEGQFHQVLLYELDAIRKACASLEEGYQPPVTFVVVQKRHHTRLFAHNHNDRNSVTRSGNILPGTVVDTSICHPREFDFYLCSHAGIQGTSRPAHYHVLWDENNCSADGLQSLTNNLCYTYARCTRSVSIVPPVYYAHLAAFRARFYVAPGTSDSGSMASGSVARGGGMGGRNTRETNVNAAVRPLPALKDNVKRVMFFC